MSESKSKWQDMTLEELEFELPMRAYRKTVKVNHCRFCGEREYTEDAEFEQKIWRSDSYGIEDKKKTRQYEISFVCDNWESHKLKDRLLFRTDRHRNYRDALIEAHELLERTKQNGND